MQHIKKIRNKCKKINNLLRCLAGQDWGANRRAMLSIYRALLRSVWDYGCLAYMSASETRLKELEREQAQGIRTCTGALKTSPISALQVEVSEMPLKIRRDQIMLTYWANLEGHGTLHPTKAILQESWEHWGIKVRSFGKVCKEVAQKLGLTGLKISRTVPTSVISPWKFYTPAIDMQLLEKNQKQYQKSAGMDNCTKLYQSTISR